MSEFISSNREQDKIYQELYRIVRENATNKVLEERLRKELNSVGEVEVSGFIPQFFDKPDTAREFYSENEMTESYKYSDTESGSIQSNMSKDGINHVNDDGNWNNASGYGLHRRMGLYLADMYQKKNSDYGDAFGKSLDKHGMKAAIVRMEDKLGRLDSLTSGADQQVFDEKLEDTVLDLANYAIMTAMYMIEKGR